jgi:hypothetical protein
MATTDDRERLEAIANAIMATHVARQQQASGRLHGQERKPGRRWMRIGVLFLVAPLLLQVLTDAVSGEGMSPFGWVVVASVPVLVFLFFRKKT